MTKNFCKVGSLIATLLILFVCMAGSASATVNLYAEGAYTESDLKVYIYADVTAGAPIVSFGVKTDL